MKRFALMVIITLCLGNVTQAAIIDLTPAHAGKTVAKPPVPDLAVTRHDHVIAPPGRMSELPEPEVFAMMLVGLILIGYRAGRDSSDIFK